MMETARRFSLPAEDEVGEPPAYTPFPRPEEQSIDAGAGAPIVRAQAPQLVVNPSDPRSHFTRQYFGNSPPVPPPRPDVSSGPLPVNPRLPPRLNMGYDQMEVAPHRTPRSQMSLTQLNHVGGTLPRSTSVAPRSAHEESALHRPVTTGVFAHTPPGPAANTISYSTLRGSSSGSNWRNQYAPDGLLSSWPTARPGDGYPGVIAQQTPAVVSMTCPACRNTGWLSSRIPCSCPMGIAAKSQHSSRPLHTAVLNFLEDFLGPEPSPYQHHQAPYNQQIHSHSSHHYQQQPQYFHTAHGDSAIPAYAFLIPGTGALCPNCAGRSYFRKPEMQAHSATREIEAEFGGPPPPCTVCCDNGRLR
ncbi:hypothetical protein GGI07_004589 [Coemansia sp. Benny D115]|nr:hypothetical protein GGI07_004589 [Coemansia sp. Benny D115]